MATYQQIELQKITLNEQVTGEMSIYSESLRNRLGRITAYQSDFEKAFGGFVENSLPKDTLYKQIEKQFEDKKKGKKDGGMGSSSYLEKIRPKPEEDILPNTNIDESEKVHIEVAKMKA